MKLSIKSVLMAFSLCLYLVPTSIMAETPGKHKAYFRALAHLRYARAYLDKLGPDDAVDNNFMHAIQAIDGVIAEIKRASIDDGKDLRDHPPIDAHLSKKDRFRKAAELVHKACNEIKEGQSDKVAVDVVRKSGQLDAYDAAQVAAYDNAPINVDK